MAEFILQRWHSQGEGGLSRQDRRSCEYRAYLPDKLDGRPILLEGGVAADVAEAEAAMARLDLEATALVDTEVLARLLLRAESVASSRIEGLEIGGRRLLRAEAARQMGEEPRDVTASEVLGNIDAMVWATQSMPAGSEITVEALLEIHRRLLLHTRLEAHAGRIRTEQNWIGGSSYNPCSAAFVPPPPENVPTLLDDLCSFCNDDALPAVVQAALAHAQFETIHPFVDGNGRTGRALIHLVLRRRGLAQRVLPPLSLILATWSEDYVAALMGTRYEGAPESTQAHEGLNHWIGLFAAACKRAVEDATEFEERLRELQYEWRRRLGTVRARSALDLLIRALPGAPIVTVNSAADLTGRSFQAANEATLRLVDAGILSQINVGRRNRAFEAREVVEAFTWLERKLASPGGDTRTSAPSRVVPPRRR
jgi:Fic family protein